MKRFLPMLTATPLIIFACSPADPTASQDNSGDWNLVAAFPTPTTTNDGTNNGGDGNPVNGPDTDACQTLNEACNDNCDGDYDNVECEGTLSGSYDNVVVPEGATCTLSDILITGNLEVEEGGSVVIDGPAFVCGNFKADEAARATTLAGAGEAATTTNVCGNLEISEVGEADIAGALVYGNGEFEESQAIAVDGVRICDDAEFTENADVVVGASDGVVIEDDCEAEDNDVADFGLVEVFGDNEGCLGL